MGKPVIGEEVNRMLLLGGKCTVRVRRLERMLRCSDCGSQELEDDSRSGDLVCVGCGLVCRERTMVASYDVRVVRLPGHMEV